MRRINLLQPGPNPYMHPQSETFVAGPPSFPSGPFAPVSFTHFTVNLNKMVEASSNQEYCFSHNGPAIIVNNPRFFYSNSVNYPVQTVPLPCNQMSQMANLTGNLDSLLGTNKPPYESQTTFTRMTGTNKAQSDLIFNIPPKEDTYVTSASQNQEGRQLDDCSQELVDGQQLVYEQRIKYPESQPQGVKLNVDLLKLKTLFFQYFFKPTINPFPHVLSHDEVNIIRLLLMKKLIHDTNESKLYQAISSLHSDQVESFMDAHKPINRKNVIKMNIFIKIWHVLEHRHGAEFFNHYFAAYPDSDITLQTVETNRLTKSIKVTDQFYSQCFLSEPFKRDFFQTLFDSEFRKNVIEKAKNKFLKNFEFWVIKISRFLIKINGKFKRKMRIPEIKFGLSEADYDTSLDLFKKLLAKRKNWAS